MKKSLRKGISMVLVLILLTVTLPGVFIPASGAPLIAGVEPAPKAGLAVTADKSAVTGGEKIDFTVEFNMLAEIISGYSKTRIAVFLPAGLDFENGVLYVGGAPLALTVSPAATPMGASIIIELDNTIMRAGRAQLRITANVSEKWDKSSITVGAGLYWQPSGGDMPFKPDEEASFTLQRLDLSMPEIPPAVTPPVAPVIYKVQFYLNGGYRVGGGALNQVVPAGESAVAPYVSRDGYYFRGWNMSFNNVQYDLYVTALWETAYQIPDPGPITINPDFTLIEGYFADGKNIFTQFSHRPMIYYVDQRVSYFRDVEIDGHILKEGEHYIATAGTAAGTTAIHLKASYLNTLPAFVHTFRVNFRNDEYANAQLAVEGYANKFRDVNQNDWFYKGVESMNASGLLLGVTDTQFNPYATMTRGQIVTLLYRFVGEPNVSGFWNPFPDVDAGQYYTDAVVWAAANGIVFGHETGNFAPHDEMTQEQFAAVLYRYQNALGSTALDILMDREYSDRGEIASYAEPAVNKLTMQGAYRDYPYSPGNLFRPRDPVTRAEAAAVMRLWIESMDW